MDSTNHPSATLNPLGNGNKYVRLIVSSQNEANGKTGGKVNNHITAHIEPISVNAASNSVSSGMSSPTDRTDILKLAAERMLGKGEDFEGRCNGSDGYFEGKGNGSGVADKISESIKYVW